MHVQKIELEGKEYPICFPASAFAEFERLAGISTFEFLEKLDARMVSFTTLCHLVASGLNAGARKSGNDARFTAETAGDIFGFADVSKIMPVINDSLAVTTGNEKNELPAPMEVATPPEPT
jgi:hypothetical protein